MTEPTVRLSPFTAADLTPAYVSWLNDPETVRFSNQRFRKHTLETCRAYFDSFAGTDNLLLSVKAGGVQVGTMTAYVQSHHGTGDMGILIGREHWGQGYGRAAWNELLDTLLARFRKVTGGTLACNTGMVRIMERAGMTLEGRRVGQELIDGVPQDILLFGKFA